MSVDLKVFQDILEEVKEFEIERSLEDIVYELGHMYAGIKHLLPQGWGSIKSIKSYELLWEEGDEYCFSVFELNRVIYETMYYRSPHSGFIYNSIIDTIRIVDL